MKQGSDGVPLWCVLRRNLIGKFVLGEVIWDELIFDTHQMRKEGAWGLLENCHGRKGKSFAHSPCPLREKKTFTHTHSATKETAKN